MSIYIFKYRFHILLYPGQSWRLKYHIRLYRSLGCGANIKQQNNPRALVDTDAGLILGSRLANERVARNVWTCFDTIEYTTHTYILNISPKQQNEACANA